MGIPILRTKLLAFALSGFIAGYAGVCFAFATQPLNNTDITFDPTTSFVIISMVVIGGLGSISGAMLGALYLRASRPCSGPIRRSSSSPAASDSWPSSSTSPADWPRCCTVSATW